MPTPFEISDRFTEQWADAMPIDSTYFGISGRDALCTDYSPEAHGALADLYRSTRQDLADSDVDGDESQAFGAEVLSGWLSERIAEYDAGKWRRDLNHIDSPFQGMRDVFDIMPTTSPDDWDAVVARLAGFPKMLEGYTESLEVGLAAGDTVARRQVESVIDQANIASSQDSPFAKFLERAEASAVDVGRVGRAVDEARSACAEFASWLTRRYLPNAREEDAVGREVYLQGADEFLGMTIDPDETYEWGWSEVHRLMKEMESTARSIDPEMTLGEVIEMLDSDSRRAAGSGEEFVEFVSGIQDQAIAQLAGTHFDVPDELKAVTVNIAPPGGSLGAWYVSPSEDLTRPGSIWYSHGDRQFVPYWQEVSTAYHEGFPGHHLQVGTAVMQRDRLSRFHRTVIWYAGSGEGWALYAERLMDELDYFEKPEYRLGLMASQLFRSVRVVVDIGCQLGLRIPADAPLHAGDIWDYDRAVDYMHRVGLQPLDLSESEVKRYLGWWGQAISYKVGEREILAIREEARRRPGFELKTFHQRMLQAGGIRLDHLREVMS